ncbi:cytochrome b561 and DOMON domain-containing protein At5g47530-like [Impatiens glandulifera]|uniref:cytochrome b561 and DOMON domain-containing protein At5g47530-like n=1 Tax=Impatiens glandulifera TaxID=253017 RepID=UPI001FB0F55E|nr:cytochrome b561 and DOMON domain-containing protein At5g47530-like [Impatiens glandulifera]
MKQLEKATSLILLPLLINLLVPSSSAQNCNSVSFSGGRKYSNCISLPVLNSFLHWNYHQPNQTVQIAYLQTGVSPSNWVAWGLNVGGGSGMIGTQALIAFQNSRGAVQAYTSQITNYATTLSQGPLSFNVENISAEFVNNDQMMIIYAILDLPAGRSSFNHVWQTGFLSGDSPLRHNLTGANVRSLGTVDFGNGTTVHSSDNQQDRNDCNPTSLSGDMTYSKCNVLPALNSFLYWNYYQDNHTVDIAYRHTDVSSSNWIAWAINVDGSGMIGAQTLVAFQSSGGAMQAYTSSITSYGTSLSRGSLSFKVLNISAELVNNEMIIYAKIELPAGRSSFNQVWQMGPLSGDSPGKHLTNGANIRSTGTVDFVGGTVQSTGGGGDRGKNKNVNTLFLFVLLFITNNGHGILNAISWGILMPLGAMIARYLKVFKSADPLWFYIHVTCQTSAYMIGVAGWVTGLKLGEKSGVQNTMHRNIGITLFCLGTLQLLALLLRPNKEHKHRFYWNLYHWGVGYTVIILTIINIFKGLEILNPAKGWKQAYIGILIFFGVNAVMLEAYTWYLVLKNRKKESLAANDKYPQTT